LPYRDDQLIVAGLYREPYDDPFLAMGREDGENGHRKEADRRERRFILRRVVETILQNPQVASEAIS
jgi:hypothetical protein